MAEYRARILTSQPSAPPGERFEYSNAGFTVLGWVTETVEGAPLDSVLRRRIFRPLGMTYVTGGHASGGISLSILDLAKFAVALQRNALLPPAWRDSAWAGGRLADGRPAMTSMFGDSAQYGFGWFVARYRGRRVITHGGGINGYSSMLLHFPADSLTIGVLANARAPVEPIVRAIADLCLGPGRCTMGQRRPGNPSDNGTRGGVL